MPTPSLRFRELSINDAKDLYEIYSDREAMKYRTSKPMTSKSDAVEFIDNKNVTTERSQIFRKGIILNDTKQLIGSVMLSIDHDTPHACEIGYSIGRQYWGRGYGKETVKELLRMIKEKYDFKEVIAWCHHENQASLKILNQLGFIYTAQNAEKTISCYRKYVQ
ncbi:N-acetyltransferase [Fulvivirga sp. RKSG066]|uniref:GNAT family N-acetyltransferase n=1 Tax=Fulvivirga aurantia TaxID=2529383 RepID=UPI0012BD5302|nr:GNAT family N-acetyltransferase [Fulvivirga aurantia]MTI21900.1 N-acetyltransferase [Fulvivirga aurantia]